MKTLLCCVAFLMSVLVAHADKRAMSLVDDINGKTQVPYCFFDIGEFKRGLYFNIHSFRFGTRTPKWLYKITARGSGDVYAFEKVAVENEMSGSRATPVVLAGGTLLIDRKKRFVTVAFKVSVAGTIEDFEGNGTFKLERSAFERKS
jgi:hypothetical protein